MKQFNCHVATLFQIRNQLHYFHFQTKSFAQHEMLGDLYSSLLDKIDELTECYMGKYNCVVEVAEPDKDVTLVDYKDKEQVKRLLRLYLVKIFNMSEELMKDHESNIDLQNILADVMNDFNRSIYKLNFN